MSVITKPISEVVEVNPRMPADIACDLKLAVDFIPMAQLSEQGYVIPNGSRQLGEVIKGYTYFENGDVLVAKITPCMENGKAAYVNNLPHQIGFGSTEFHVLRPRDCVYGRYLFYMIWNSEFRDEAEGNMTGSAGQKRVPKSFFDRFEIPLPPLSEQKRIADILDKADSIRRKRQETVTVAEGFVSALFMEMFASHHSAHSDTVKVMSFDDAISDFIDYRGKTPCKSTSGVPLVTAKVVKGGRILPPDEFIPDGDYDAWMRRGLPLRGDVLFTTEAPLGEVAQVADERIALAQRVLLMRGKKGVLNNTFLRLAIKTPFVWNQIQRRSTGSTVRGIRQKELRQVTLPVPSIAEQEQFERIAQRQEQSIEVLRTSATHADLLFNSLVQRAFKREL